MAHAHAKRDIIAAGRDVHIHEAARSGISVRHQLPPMPYAFTGRDDLLEGLIRELTGDGAVGVSISAAHAGLQGMGGVGKTALAVVLAHRLCDRYSDAQLFLNLRGAGTDASGGYSPGSAKAVTSAEAMETIIHCFHPEAQLPESLDALAPIYRSTLASAGRVLLLLDNAADAAQVKPLLPPPGCLLLVTSRTQFEFPGLARRNIDCLSPEKSRELLLRLAPRLAGSENEAAELCGHLPLALEVFSGAVNDRSLISVPELVARLRAGKDRLLAVEAAFEVSAGLFDEALRRDWMLLAVFSASFDLRASAMVWKRDIESARDAMQALVRASLVEWNEAVARFRLHDLVRQFCDGQLSEADRDFARLRHAEHYRDMGAEADALYKRGGADVRRGMELFDRERAHIEAAFDWLQARRDPVSADLLVSLVDAVVFTGQSLHFHPRQGVRWLEAQRDAARIVGNRNAEGAALGNLGIAYAALGDSRKAIEFYEQRLVIAHELGDRHGEGGALGNLGNAYTALGDTRKAIEFHKQGLVIDRETGDRRGEGNTLGNLGNVYTALGDTRKAIEFYEQHLVIAREIGDRLGEGSALGNLGNAYFVLVDARKAIEFYEQALAIDREIGDRRGEGNALGNLGIAYAALGDTRKAIEFYEQQLAITREIGDRRGEGNAFWNSARQFAHLGNNTEAIARAEAALQIYESIENPNVTMVRASLAKWRSGR